MTTSSRLLSEAFLTAHPENAAAAIEELDLADAASFLSEASAERPNHCSYHR